MTAQFDEAPTHCRNERLTAAGSSPATIRTRRERRSASGQCSRWIGRWTTWRTPLMYIGRLAPSTFRMPFNRRILSPYAWSRSVTHTPKAGQSIGRSTTIETAWTLGCTPSCAYRWFRRSVSGIYCERSRSCCTNAFAPSESFARKFENVELVPIVSRAKGLMARILPRTAVCCAEDVKSLLVRITQSAAEICRSASIGHSVPANALTASTVVITHPRRT